MKIIDLTAEHLDSYLVCLEDWSDELKEAGDWKAKWYNEMKDKGLRVKLAQDDNGVVGGMIQYFPIEHSWVSGRDMYFIACIWVHGYKQGRGNFMKRGMGTALLQAAEEDIKALGSKGVVAWGIALPFWMKASWFKKHGFEKVDQNGFLGEVLLWKPFAGDAEKPSWIHEKKLPARKEGQVTVSCFVNGWCPAMSLSCERAKRAAAELGDKVKVEQIETLNPATFAEWGISDALYIDGKAVRNGPPPSFKKIKSKIEAGLKKIK